MRKEANVDNRISLLLSSFLGRGVTRIRLNLAAGFVARGFSVDLLVADVRGEMAGEVPAGVRVVDLGAPRMLCALPRLVNYLRRERPVLMLSAEDHSNVIALWARRWTGYPKRVSVSCHVLHSVGAGNAWSTKAHWMRYFVRCFYPWASAIIAISQGMAEDMARTTGLPRRRITVIPNAVVTPKLFEDACAPIPHPWLEPGGLPVVLGVGWLDPPKQFDVLLRAFALMRADRPARLMILGSGPEEARLKVLAGELGIDEDVHFAGFVINPFAYMSRASLFVLASAWEGLPGVLIQAMACGCPVVSTDCRTGPDEILDYGRYGRLVPVGDHQAMAQAMVATLDDPPAPEFLKARAMDFHVDKVIDKYLEVLNP